MAGDQATLACRADAGVRVDAASSLWNVVSGTKRFFRARGSKEFSITGSLRPPLCPPWASCPGAHGLIVETGSGKPAAPGGGPSLCLGGGPGKLLGQMSALCFAGQQDSPGKAGWARTKEPTEVRGEPSWLSRGRGVRGGWVWRPAGARSQLSEAGGVADLARATCTSESLAEPKEEEAECGDVEKAVMPLWRVIEEPSGHLLPEDPA